MQMTQNTHADEAESELVDEKYRPVYEFLPDAGPLGKVVCNVPEADQESALGRIAGEGAIEPDGWMRGYGGASVPVVEGVPIAVLDQRRPNSVRTEGVETTQQYTIGQYSVRVDKAFAHPGNTSKIKVEERVNE